MKEAWGYVDPGTGYVFLQNTSFFWGWLIGLFMFLLFPFRYIFRLIKKPFWILIILTLILIIVGGWIIMKKDVEGKKLIILGIDAMDPKIALQLMNEGKLPNFSSLKANGSFSSLKTTNPPESIVAWSSFITGLNPGGHGIFDFIMRTPENYFPYLAFDEISSGADQPQIKNRRKGQAFWEILSENNIPAGIYFCPNTFPPGKISGKMVSGMGVTDILGFIGKFSFYTSKMLSEEDKESRGRVVQVFPEKNQIRTQLFGPKVSSRLGDTDESKVPLNISINSSKEEISLQFQAKRVILKKNSWSNWQKVSFKVGTFKNVSGIVRFYLKEIAPDFELYCSPINIDPENPLFPISHPFDYSKSLAKKTGLFYTQGMPHDTWALTENRLSEDAFLEHADMILEEKKIILKEELSKFRAGVFFYYFETLDAIQHMFWRYIDTKHPLYEANSRYKDTIYRYYQKMDEVLGEILKKIDKDTTLIVLSDHGFSSFRRSAHLNRWLLENGFLFLKAGQDEGKEFFEEVDWQKTKAYALGFGGIYINRLGREREGIVDDSEAGELKKQIQEKLAAWYDTATEEYVVKEAYDGEKIFTGPYVKDGPDLFVGFRYGFRASWQTALGGTPKALIEDNKKKWSGDHLTDPSLVPGVLFINKKIDLNDPGIINISSTVLGLFNIPQPEKEQGKGLF